MTLQAAAEALGRMTGVWKLRWKRERVSTAAHSDTGWPSSPC